MSQVWGDLLEGRQRCGIRCLLLVQVGTRRKVELQLGWVEPITARLAGVLEGGRGGGVSPVHVGFRAWLLEGRYCCGVGHSGLLHATLLF